MVSGRLALLLSSLFGLTACYSFRSGPRHNHCLLTLAVVYTKRKPLPRGGQLRRLRSGRAGTGLADPQTLPLSARVVKVLDGPTIESAVERCL